MLHRLLSHSLVDATLPIDTSIPEEERSLFNQMGIHIPIHTGRKVWLVYDIIIMRSYVHFLLLLEVWSLDMTRVWYVVLFCYWQF